MPGRPKNPPPDRRQEILDAALRVFARRGYTAATNAEIAREAGVTAAALYHYFPSKADLFKAALTERRGTFLPAIDQVAQQVAALPPEMVLSMLVETVAGFAQAERTQALMRILLAEAPRNPELVQLWQEQIVAPGAELILGYIRGQVEKGTLAPVDPRIIFLLLNGPILMTTIMKEIAGIPLVADLRYEDLVEQIKRLILPVMLRK